MNSFIRRVERQKFLKLAETAFTLMVHHGLDPRDFVEWYAAEGILLSENQMVKETRYWLSDQMRFVEADQPFNAQHGPKKATPFWSGAGGALGGLGKGGAVGAATGAAVGGGVDLATGGATGGAGAALGAVGGAAIGGGRGAVQGAKSAIAANQQHVNQHNAQPQNHPAIPQALTALDNLSKKLSPDLIQNAGFSQSLHYLIASLRSGELVPTAQAAPPGAQLTQGGQQQRRTGVSMQTGEGGGGTATVNAGGAAPTGAQPVSSMASNAGANVGAGGAAMAGNSAPGMHLVGDEFNATAGPSANVPSDVDQPQLQGFDQNYDAFGNPIPQQAQQAQPRPMANQDRRYERDHYNPQLDSLNKLITERKIEKACNKMISMGVDPMLFAEWYSKKGRHLRRGNFREGFGDFMAQVGAGIGNVFGDGGFTGGYRQERDRRLLMARGQALMALDQLKIHAQSTGLGGAEFIKHIDVVLNQLQAAEQKAQQQGEEQGGEEQQGNEQGEDQSLSMLKELAGKIGANPNDWEMAFKQISQSRPTFQQEMQNVDNPQKLFALLTKWQKEGVWKAGLGNQQFLPGAGVNMVGAGDAAGIGGSVTTGDADGTTADVGINKGATAAGVQAAMQPANQNYTNFATQGDDGKGFSSAIDTDNDEEYDKMMKQFQQPKNMRGEHHSRQKTDDQLFFESLRKQMGRKPAPRPKTNWFM